MMNVHERWKNLPDYPYQMRTPRGWIREKAREFMKMVVRGHYWVAPNDLQKKYGISNNSATIIVHEVHASLKVNAMPVHRFGFRDDTYFTEDYLLNGVKYSPEDLKGEELEIYNSL